MGGDHTHSHAGHSHGVDRDTQRRVLWICLGLNAGFLLAEVAGGIAFNSLALLADAGHMLSDVVGLGIALVAFRLLARPATARHSFGLQRAEVLGGLLNGVVLLAVAGWIVYEALQRFGEPEDIRGGGMLAVAVIGLGVNVGSAVLLARSRGRSLNMHGAYLHMLLDAAGSVGAIIAAVAVIAFDATWVDPAVSILIAVLVVWSTWGLLRDSVDVLLEATPRHVDLDAIDAALREDESVADVHHTHVWSLASDVTALSSHLVLADTEDLHQAQVESDRLKSMLRDRFDIDHATLELECHRCDDDALGTVVHPFHDDWRPQSPSM